METRKLGSQGLVSSAIGLGCMGMSEFYGETDETESIKVIHAALDNGITLLDTADMYGVGHNERLVGKAVKDRRDGVVVATKFGIVREAGSMAFSICGTPEYVKSACEKSLKNLGIDTIDLYYQHRVDPNVPIEDTVGAMAELVKEGKVKYLGMSEAGADNIRRAHRVHPISALQTEYSLWTRDIEDEILPCVRELGISLVAYSPLSRGFLSADIKKESFNGDFRSNLPRFSGENFDNNKKLVDEMTKIADSLGCTTAQLAIAWVLSRGDDIVPIPGTKRMKYLMDNINSVNVKLTGETVAMLERIISPDKVKGMRYPEERMRALEK